MTKYLKNENNCMMLYHNNKKEDLQQPVKISNYSLESLFAIKFVTNTKNSYNLIEKLAL